MSINHPPTVAVGQTPEEVEAAYERWQEQTGRQSFRRLCAKDKAKIASNIKQRPRYEG